MGAKDFRVGNSIQQGTILAIKANGVVIGGHYEVRGSSFFKGAQEAVFVETLIAYEDVWPIRLTEEKLLELGFKKSYPAGWYDKNGIEIFNSNMKTGAYDYYFSSKTLTVMYVHELQNLYSLTGEELTINK